MTRISPGLENVDKIQTLQLHLIETDRVDETLFSNVQFVLQNVVDNHGQLWKYSMGLVQNICSKTTDTNSQLE